MFPDKYDYNSYPLIYCASWGEMHGISGDPVTKLGEVSISSIVKHNIGGNIIKVSSMV